MLNHSAKGYVFRGQGQLEDDLENGESDEVQEELVSSEAGTSED
jgi:hypothetical protein